jgi:hypothetical protein
MREGTTSRVMAADRRYGEVYDFYSVSPKYFAYRLVCENQSSEIWRRVEFTDVLEEYKSHSAD